jgi:prepilin-type N-terminal cleavage/methylation domain-containing protein
MRSNSAGFSLIELMVAMTIMLVISGAAVTAMLKLSTTQATIWNRTQMHSGIRGATEVLQQEVGQAGRISLPNTVMLASDANLGATALTVGTNQTAGMFNGEKLTLGGGSSQETVTVSADPSSGTVVSISATKYAHYAGDYVSVQGGFSAGIVPPASGGYTNGSTSSVLKLFGDINGDGSMVYIEYSVQPACICTNTCTPSTTTGNLYRNSMAWDSASKTPAAASQILLANLTPNPASPTSAPCFTYQPAVYGTDTYVTDVAVTLTVQTQNIDPVTKTAQKETKALLNVSPRNVFNTWQLATFGYSDRVQTIPTKVAALLGGAS